MRFGWIVCVGALAVACAGAAWAAEWPDLSSVPASNGGGEADAALVVGIEDYTYVAGVPGAVDNANDWYAWLTRTRGVPVGSVILLRNHDGTREKLLRSAEQVAGQVGSGGTLWLVFIGHGAPSRDGRDGLLLGVDTQQSADSVEARGLSQQALLEALEQGAQERTLVVLDACFSGKGSRGDTLVDGLQPLVPTYTLQRGQATVLSAGQSDQFAGPLPGAARPAFSYLVLGGLRGWADADGDRAVTAREAVDYARDTMLALVRDRTQTPGGEGPAMDDLIARGREQGPDIAAMVLAGGGGPAPVPDPVVGHVETSTGSDTDLLAAARELERLKAEREAREARERELEERLAAERRRAREEAEDALLADARSEWVALASLRDGGGPEAVQIVELYVDKYGDATVTVDGESYPVQIAQVSEAREWLERNAGKAVRAVCGGGLGGSVIDAHGYELVAIEAGEFWMGSPSGEEDRDGDETRHRVRLTRGFALGATEVTQGLYEAVMGENPSHFAGGNRPVEQVSWLDAVTFCNALSEQEGLTPAYQKSRSSVTWDRDADGYRLPTEAEWEFAARGGDDHLYSGSDDLGSVGWYSSNSGKKTRDVGEKRANGYGLHDMSGNVWEWAWDWYGDYPSGTVSDPTGPSTGSPRVARGGSWSNNPRCARVAVRLRHAPGYRYYYLGFRLARSLP